MSEDVEDFGPPLMPKDVFSRLESDLAALDDCELNEWDRDFVDGLAKRVMRWKRRTQISSKQWEHLGRMKGQYL